MVSFASQQILSGTASAGNASGSINPPPPKASLVPRYGVAQGNREGDKHLRPSHQLK